jgi:hypothetical protein
MPILGRVLSLVILYGLFKGGLSCGIRMEALRCWLREIVAVVSQVESVYPRVICAHSVALPAAIV